MGHPYVYAKSSAPKKTFILGLGSQGARAQNWRDSKLTFQILRENMPGRRMPATPTFRTSCTSCTSIQEAQTRPVHHVLQRGRPENNDIFAMLIPDHTHKEVLQFLLSTVAISR